MSRCRAVITILLTVRLICMRAEPAYTTADNSGTPTTRATVIDGSGAAGLDPTTDLSLEVTSGSATTTSLVTTTAERSFKQKMNDKIEERAGKYRAVMSLMKMMKSRNNQ